MNLRSSRRSTGRKAGATAAASPAGAKPRARRSSTVPRPLRAQLRETVAQAILDAAEEVIAARGLPGASMQAIAERAGIAVGTLYNYHRDRDDLMAALFAARRAAIVPHIEAAAVFDPGASFESRLRGFVHSMLALFEQKRRFMRVALEAEHMKLNPVRGQRRASPSPSARQPGSTGHKQVLHAMHEALTSIVGAGVVEGVLMPGRDALYARMIAGLLRASVLLRTETDEPMEPDADVLVDTFLHGARRNGAP